MTVGLADPALGFAPGNVLSIAFEWLYLGMVLTCFVLSLGNTPQGNKKLYMTIVIVWAVLMVYGLTLQNFKCKAPSLTKPRYLLFAAIFLCVKSLRGQLAESGGRLTADSIFRNQPSRDLLLSLSSTYVLYFVASFMFFEPWHMFTSVSCCGPAAVFTIALDLSNEYLVCAIPTPVAVLH